MHYDSCQGGCMAAKFFTGLPLDGPDPECVRGFGEQALAARDRRAGIPKPERRPLPRSAPRTSRGPVPLTLTTAAPDKACETSPLSRLAGDASDSRLRDRSPAADPMTAGAGPAPRVRRRQRSGCGGLRGTGAGAPDRRLRSRRGAPTRPCARASGSGS